MKFFIKILLLASLAACTKTTPTAEKSTEKTAQQRPEYALVVHGGAGTIRKEDLSPEKETAIRAALDAALTTGENVLKNGGSAMDAVEQVIALLEDSPEFNAGRGAVFTHEGKNELDASFMDGTSQKAGAVGGVTNIKNPIKLARKVMEKSQHVLLTGRGAEQFGKEQGVEIVQPEYFKTEERWQSLQKALELERAEKDNPQKLLQNKPTENQGFRNSDSKFGTVGCVALDQKGNIAAGTSTGGMTNKRWNRFGDSPIIGAGTYADSEVVGVSCTGHGEFFIRYSVAHDVWASMAYKNLSVGEAADWIIHKKLKEKGGEGGLIALDRLGNVAMAFNSEGMYRGWAKPGGQREILFYK